ncbi:single-stranded-DNA-specific exonuclease RecJ [Lentibacillus populi]|uniref:Single-stranded-DNA-specific exonuclease RecJ n=1 Tax=Lentibacillus populi TaxID=1827502 RepID=A0A9W5TUE8_9BACI|nr:single-stranded-DNA-specific exonuclease RecJ [Lentibacillus populi]GGB28490.1 single-stranded-DNA-specific exonuclease RecJ [Lentibacillus populi]
MLQSKAKWKFATNNESLQWMDDTIQLSPVTKELLLQRGITTANQAREFLSPSLTNLHSPHHLASIEKASLRVHKAIEQNEKILIYGDYDADGVSSTTVLLIALRKLGAACDYYIPNRFTEGYGPNEAAFRKAYEDGFRLIITVDNGIAAVHEANIAKELGLDLIITDHHEPQEQLPDAFAIIHPKCSPDYLFQELAGVGVAFKFAEQLLGYFPEQLLDLVAIGTIADLVPLVNENRILAYYGLRKLTTTNRQGLKALKKWCKIEGTVTEEDIGFLIGPRLNAVGRLQDADLAVQLLLTDDQEEAEELAEMVEQLNRQRQQIVADIVKEAEGMVQPADQSGVIVVAREGWNEGVLGIVASRLVQKYDRPAIVLAIHPEEERIKGSARSIPAFDLFKNCMRIRELFTHFGGHAQAAGMTLPLHNLHDLKKHLNELIHQQLTAEDFKQEIVISKTLKISEATESLVNELEQLAPFGMANPKPIFHIKQVPAEIRQLGNNKKHLKLHFREDTCQLDGIGFGLGDLYPKISQQANVSLVGEIGINEWNGMRKPQMVIRDLRIDEWQLFDHRGKKQLDLTLYDSNPEVDYAVCRQITERIPKDLGIVTYDMDFAALDKVSSLFIFDLPPDLGKLEDLIKKTKPATIHACFNVENSMYMQVFPSRDDFKWFYAQILKRKTIDLNGELEMLMRARGWTKDRIVFMSKVFFELGFVKIDNGVIDYNPTPVKSDLRDSKVYQKRLRQADIEKTLYYSNYKVLKKWFSFCMADVEVPKEEKVTHGI